MSEAFLYRVGDEFQGSQAGISRFLQAVRSVGGQVEINGDTARITYLPPTVTSKVENVKNERVKPVADSKPKQFKKVEEAKVVEDTKIEESEEEVKSEPKKRGRKTKTGPVSKEEFVSTEESDSKKEPVSEGKKFFGYTKEDLD